MGVIFLTVSGVGYWAVKDTPIQTIPYPYLVNIDEPSDLLLAEQAQILIIGDRLGLSLGKFLPEIINELSKNLKEPLRTYVWAKEHEGLHRTLNKLKMLKKWPKAVIYLGASEEGYEKKFNIKDFSRIMLNFKAFNNATLSTLIMAFPPSSKVVYRQTNMVSLDKEIKARNETSFSTGADELNFLKLHFKIFESELRELHGLLREHEVTLISLTTPINFDVSPKKVCSDMVTPTTMSEEVRAEEMINSGDFKSAFNLLTPIVQNLPGHSRMTFLYAKSAMQSGQMAFAKENFIKSAAFDCELWRGHPIFNELIRRLSSEYGQTLIDYANILLGHYGRDETFLNDYYPQDFYQKLTMQMIKEKLKKIFNL